MRVLLRASAPRVQGPGRGPKSKVPSAYLQRATRTRSFQSPPSQPKPRTHWPPPQSRYGTWRLPPEPRSTVPGRTMYFPRISAGIAAWLARKRGASASPKLPSSITACLRIASPPTFDSPFSRKEINSRSSTRKSDIGTSSSTVQPRGTSAVTSVDRTMAGFDFAPGRAAMMDSTSLIANSRPSEVPSWWYSSSRRPRLRPSSPTIVQNAAVKPAPDTIEGMSRLLRAIRHLTVKAIPHLSNVPRPQTTMLARHFS